MAASSATMSLTIRPSAMAPGLIPVSSIRIPVPSALNRAKVKPPFASRPACIRTTPFSSFHCWVAPEIVMPPSSDAMRNLFVLMVPDNKSPTVTVCITAFRIRALSITAFAVVRWMFCKSPTPAFPARRDLILALSASSTPIDAFAASRSVIFA